ncbi:CHAT domain-containing protein [uncultured Lacinutrix sp.]|uniref:CHAT domain-containing protein n=1 Tax=uncultured Lacinutrix sp. TaxID=574032 RepID=UPI00261B245F|nr:CHAT domain-containing protein [uncultured Lacinutrix sp.]
MPVFYKNNLKKKTHNSFKLLCVFFFIISCSFAQNTSQAYKNIFDNDKFTAVEKDSLINTLFKSYKENNNLKELVYDLKEYAVEHYRNKRIDEAISVSIQADSVCNKINNTEIELHSNLLNNLAYFYKTKGEYLNASKVYRKIIKFKSDSDVVKANIADAYTLYAQCFNSLGDFYKAAQFYENAINYFVTTKNRKELLVAINDASINYKKIGTQKSLNRGIELLNKGISLIPENKKDKDLIDYYNLYEQLANLYNERKDYNFEKSKLNYDKALKLAFQINDQELIGLTYIDIGYLYMHSNNKLAIEYFDKAIALEISSEKRSLAYGNKALYYYNTKSYDLALINTQNSINTLLNNKLKNKEELPSKEDLLVSQNKYDILSSLIEKAKIWLSFGGNERKEYANKALKTLQLADYLVDEIRLESNEQQSKLFWRKKASDIYTNAVKACYILNDTDEAFYFMEKNKAILLLEDLTEEQLKLSANVPQNIIDKQFLFKQEINELEITINNNIKFKDSLFPVLIKTKESYSSFLESLQKDFPSYSKFKKKTTVLSLEKVTDSLDENTAYIEYILNDKSGFGMVITNAETKFFKINNCDVLLEKIHLYIELLNSPFQKEEDQETFNTISYLIYNNLLPEHVLDIVKNKKLIIIPDYYLQNIPFETLKRDAQDNYLIEYNEISYAYSISFLEQNKKRIRTNELEFLGIAPIKFNNELSNLPKTEQEIKIASNLFLSNIFQYEEASSKNFISNIKNHSIIHIASHANANDDASPWIAFSDKKLSLEELYFAKNTADLVVLSACKTSLGVLNEGEGVMSLARNFFNTGANSVLSTQWNVNDKSSAQIISDFYKNLKKGKTKSQALRIAKLNYLKTHQLSERLPHYWASFVLIGDTEAIFMPNQNLNFIIAIGTFLLLVILLFLFNRKLKK